MVVWHLLNFLRSTDEPRPCHSFKCFWTSLLRNLTTQFAVHSYHQIHSRRIQSADLKEICSGLSYYNGRVDHLDGSVYFPNCKNRPSVLNVITYLISGQRLEEHPHRSTKQSLHKAGSLTWKKPSVARLYGITIPNHATVRPGTPAQVVYIGREANYIHTGV